MEKWQVEHITKNLPELITLTTFHCLVTTKLVANEILNQTADVDKLEAKKIREGKSEACNSYYKTLMGRAGAYKVLYNALVETNQSGAARILVRVPPELFSEPLTYLGISTEVNEFQNVKIEVNGKSLKLKEFLPRADYKIVQHIFQETIPQVEFYSSFITKETKFVLLKNTIPPKPSYYIPRYLSNQIKLDESIFKCESSDVFVFKNNIARYKLSQIAKPHFTDSSTSQLTKITCRFIYLNEYEDWIDLKKLAKGPIHLINYEADLNIYILEDTSAQSDILRKLGSPQERVYMSEEDFVQRQLSGDSRESSNVCICDNPGMGKSFLLANIARLMTEKYVRRITAFIQLTSFSTDCCTESSYTILHPETSLINVLGYISLPRQNPDLLLKLVKAKLLQVELFFDGFDEISYEKTEWTKQIFEIITKNFPTVRIYITSRLHMRQELESSLGIVAYNILPFHHKNQVDFLVQYWLNSKPSCDILSLENYASCCLEAVNESLTKNDREIAGIPLLCMLIAEVYRDRLSLQSVKRQKICDVRAKLSGMYKKITEKRINLLATNKEEFYMIKLVHIWHGLKLLFPNSDFHEDKQFKTVQGLLTSPEILRVGILQIQLNGALEFIHRTFGEYLVAKYFFTKLQDKEMLKTEEMSCSSMSMIELLLKCQRTEHKYELNVEKSYNFLHPVIVSFFNTGLNDRNISEELKIQAAAFISFISHDDFICTLCACCQHNLLNIFTLLRESLMKWDNHLVLQLFSNENSYELLTVCIKKSTSQMFHSCIRILTEELHLDVSQINTIDKENTLLQMAVRCANYEAVEYFVDRISLKSQKILMQCVNYCYYNEDIEKIQNILHILHNKDSTLIHENSEILVPDVRNQTIDVWLFKMLVEFGANLTAVNEDDNNCTMATALYMLPNEYHELVQFLLTDCKAEHLFLDNEKWTDPLPQIIQDAKLLPETLELLLNITGIDIHMKGRDSENLLFSAVKGNKLENLQHLVNRGLDYNARGCRNSSLLHVAAKHGEVDMVRYLLSLKLDPNSRDENEWTPLHCAARVIQRLPVVEVLVKNGANVHAKIIGDKLLSICLLQAIIVQVLK